LRIAEAPQMADHSSTAEQRNMLFWSGFVVFTFFWGVLSFFEKRPGRRSEMVEDGGTWKGRREWPMPGDSGPREARDKEVSANERQRRWPKAMMRNPDWPWCDKRASERWLAVRVNCFKTGATGRVESDV